jgi:ectoine hydroxylase-related dioxygenase (phytanoyl-CoA dioxygenase family)
LAIDRLREGQLAAARGLFFVCPHSPALKMRLGIDGFALVRNILSQAECDEVSRLLELADMRGAGSRRLLQEGWCKDLAHKVMAHPEVKEALPAPARIIQCTFFEKSATKNWLVPIHQDLSIPVSGWVDHPALSGWSEKEGTLFVQAPDRVLEQLLAVRVHVDSCSSEDGPLRVVPGSHELGRIEPAQAALAGRARGVAVAAERGDALLMRPLLLHSSSKSSGSGLRRVLHFVFGPEALPYGLTW